MVTRFRPDWRPKFLEVLAKTNNVKLACAHAGIERPTAYIARKREPKFKEAWDNALEDAADLLEAEARRRAVLGTDKPVFYKGIKTGEVKEYSDLLLIFLLKGARPEIYRDPPAQPSHLDADAVEELPPETAKAVLKALSTRTTPKKNA